MKTKKNFLHFISFVIELISGWLGWKGKENSHLMENDIFVSLSVSPLIRWRIDLVWHESNLEVRLVIIHKNILNVTSDFDKKPPIINSSAKTNSSHRQRQIGFTKAHIDRWIRIIMMLPYCQYRNNYKNLYAIYAGMHNLRLCFIGAPLYRKLYVCSDQICWGVDNECWVK